MPEAKKKLELIQIRCRECGGHFQSCQKCYRGQVYCCQACRVKGYRRLHRQAQIRYRKKPKGKQKHREAERRRRWEIWKKEHKGKENLSKQRTSCKDSKIRTSLIDKHQAVGIKKCLGDKGYCYLCREQGIIVKKFPRRGYGSYNKGEIINSSGSI